MDRFEWRADSTMAGSLEYQSGDFPRMRDQRQMACIHLDGLRAHAFGHKTFQIGVDGLASVETA
jgi:hypothetical protein